MTELELADVWNVDIKIDKSSYFSRVVHECPLNLGIFVHVDQSLVPTLYRISKPVLLISSLPFKTI
jgi:hypothetical protein